jgi:hypothetical protein
VLTAIFKLILAFLAFRLIAGAVRSVRKSRPRSPGPREPGSGVQSNPRDGYRDLSPYDIEDAEYEDLPRREE